MCEISAKKHGVMVNFRRADFVYFNSSGGNLSLSVWVYMYLPNVSEGNDAIKFKYNAVLTAFKSRPIVI